MNASLPVSIARCCPSQPCPQADRCARFLADCDAFHVEIDASGCIPAGGCELFIDERALALFPQPVTTVKLPQRAATWLTPIGVAA